MNKLSYFKLMVTLVLIIALAACQSSSEKTSEKQLELTIEESTGSETDVEIDDQTITIENDEFSATVSTGGDTWPDAIPSAVPQLDMGTIESVTTTETDDATSWGINYKGIDVKEVLETYNKALKDKGFKTMKVVMDKGGTVTGEKGNINVSAIAGDDRIHITVHIEK